ncbi:hypothetical protein [Saccharicrinis fermentans]|uniref:hypothetical protein n=1 Tax=Saccharicrinis fermentans TaxID=982 RepID=UPI001268D012|nr:hypothetical protein [Saccharicrinis fermentans]
MRYCLNNPLIYTDPSGEFWHLVIGAAIGGVFNWAANGAEFTWDGLGYFGIGAAAGALGAGVGAGVSSSIAGGSFGAGFVGSSSALTASSSFVTGAAIGAAIGGAGGFSGGFASGLGNGLMQGQDFGEALGSGLRDGLIGGVTGGLIGGVTDGIDAVRDSRKFWSGGYHTDGRQFYMTSDGHPVLKSRYDKFTEKVMTGKYEQGDYVYDTWENMTNRINNQISFSADSNLPGARQIYFGKGVELNSIQYSYKGYIPEGGYVLLNQQTARGFNTSLALTQSHGWKLSSPQMLIRGVSSISISRSFALPLSNVLTEGVSTSVFSLRVLATIHP